MSAFTGPAKKSFGQHFLQDLSVVDRIIEVANLSEKDTVLEIGPGQGVLTEALIKTGAKITAVEADRDLIAGLTEKFGDQITLIQGDAIGLQTSLPLKDLKYQMVANLPYNVASYILRNYLSIAPRPIRIIVMVQKEVADRICAKPPKNSVLSVACQLYAEAGLLFVVPPEAFDPAPKVQSAVVSLEFRREITKDAEDILKIVKAGFSSKRKMLKANLVSVLKIPMSRVLEAMNKIGLGENVRAQEISVSDWEKLYRELYT